MENLNLKRAESLSHGEGHNVSVLFCLEVAVAKQDNRVSKFFSSESLRQ